MLFRSEGIPDERFLFEKLRQLDDAFFSEAGQAQEVYLHNAQEGDSPLTGIRVNIGEKPMMGRAIPFLPSHNVRLLSFNEPGGIRHCFLLLWRQYLERGVALGSAKGQVWYMAGQVYEFKGKRPKSAVYLAAFQPKTSPKTGTDGGEATRATTFEELQAKVKRVCQIYGRETEQGRTSAVIVLNKLCNGYDKQLTEQEYNTLLRLIDPLFASAKNESHQQMLGLSCATLYQKSEHYQENAEEKELKEKKLAPHFGHSRVSMTNLSKIITYNSMILSDAEQVECTITGRTAADATTVQLQRWPQMEKMGEYPVDAGTLNIHCKLPKNEIIEIFSKDGNVQFVVDGNPVEADLTKRTVKGSMESQPLNDFLQYARENELKLWKAKATTEKDSLVSLLRTWYKQGVSQHPQDLISAFALFKSYSEMSAEQLKPYIDDSYAFTNHPLLAPIHEYYEGLLKRQPGTRYTDAELKDPLNYVHHLSEYVDGKDYVLLHFWNSRQPNESALPQMKSLCKTYQTKNLKVISIALNNDNYPPAWREQIEQQQLGWTQLWADDDFKSAIAQAYGIHALPEVVLIGPDGIIVACPQSVDELREALQKLPLITIDSTKKES